MSSGLNPTSVSDMISALREFKSRGSEAVEELLAAGAECVENLDPDEPAGEKANASLTEKAGKIEACLAAADRIAALLQEELEDIQQRATIANDF